MIRLSPISRPSDLPVLNPLAELKPEPASPPGGPAELPLARGRERSAGPGPGARIVRAVRAFPAHSGRGAFPRTRLRPPCGSRASPSRGARGRRRAMLFALAALTLAVPLTAQAQNATGAPGITGTARVGETLTATKGTIADPDGLHTTWFSNAATTVQWIRVDGGSDSEISSATDRTYTLVAADEGKQVKVKVDFTDDDVNDESRTSDAYPAGSTVAADTTPPTLTSAAVALDGLIIDLVFSEDLQLSNPPPASAFTVTVDGSAATISRLLVPGSALPQNRLWLELSTAITQSQAVVVSYTDPTTGDDASAIQDAAGNDALSFTTGSDNVPAVPDGSTIATEVPTDWSLKPTAVTAGTQFRLLFLSSTKRNATSTDIADYNTFIQGLAAAGHADIRTYSAGFRVIGCTADTDALVNIYTTGTGVPIYWLNGAKAADDYADFHDGSWDDEANDKNESGTNSHDTSQQVNYPFTGCAHDGTEAKSGSGLTSHALGNSARVGRPNSSAQISHGPISSGLTESRTQTRPMYGLSGVFQVAAAVVVNTPATGAPTITGTAQVGQTLTAGTTAIMDADGLTTPSYTYQWIRVATDNSETNIASATASTYTLVDADLGTTVKVKVSFTDDASNDETLTSAATAAVSAAPNTPATGAPTITGTAQVGQTLTADTTAIVDADGLTSVSYTYQWIRTAAGVDTNISGATASTYTLVGADLGTTIKVKVSFTDDASNAETLTSDATAAVAAAPDTTPPTLTSAYGTSAGNYILLVFSENLQGSNMPPASAFTVTAGGNTVTVGNVNVSPTGETLVIGVSPLIRHGQAVVATYTDPTTGDDTAAIQDTAGNDTATFTTGMNGVPYVFNTSTVTNTPATGAPTITGTAQVGQTLTAGTTAIMDDDGLTSVSYTYQWIRVDGGTETNISGATASTHTLVAADQGTTIKVRVSFTDDASNAETLTSAATAAVAAAANTPATGAPTITGTAQVGQTLTAGTTAIMDANGLTTPSYTYQWIRVATDNSETNIASATASTYTLVDADLGTTIKVKVSFTDDASNAETLTSTATAAVAAAVPNNPPAFSADTAARSVAENTAAGQNVGAALTATDADSDTLTYTLEGTDAASFDIVSGSGQIRTRTGVTYNHEAKSTYSVVVKADDGNGGTDTVTVTIAVTDVDEPPGQPAAPTVTATAGSTTSLDVTWTAPTNTGPAIASYDVQYRAGTSGNFTDGPQNVTGTSAAIGSLAADTSYEVQVRATNAEGDGDWSVAGTGRTAATVPGAPTGLTATASGATAIYLSWTAPGSTGGSAITGYKIESSSDGGSSWSDLVANTSNTTTTYAHTGLAAGDTRHYRVSAINANGAGTASNVDSAAAAATAPGAPTGLTATASGATAINLSWTAPGSTGGSAITGYKIEVSPNGTSGWTDLVANTNGTGTAYAHTGLTAGDTRHYRVSAINANGAGDPSNVDSATTAATVPGAPTGLTATASGATQINLSWSAPGSTGGSAITGYKIEVSPNGTSGWTDQVANTSNTTTTYAHTGLAAGDTRHYRVSAINANGAGTASNVANATTGQTTVTFGASSYTAAEGGATATVAVQLSAAASASVTIPLTKAHRGGATAADYSGVPSNVTFTAGQTRQTFTVTATDDSDKDGGESVQLGFGSLPGGYAPGARRTATVTLVDDDANLIVNFGTERHTTVKVRESDVWHRFTFSLSTSRYGPPNGNPQQPVTIPLVVRHVGGASQADYEGIPRSVTFRVGESVTDFRMRAKPDRKKETGEGLRLDFGPLPAGVRAGTWGPYETIEFLDEYLPDLTVWFGASSYTAAEGGADARVSIHLSEKVDVEPLVVRLSVQPGGGATSGDYSVPSSVRFAVGEQTKTIQVAAVDDTDDDDGESVTLSFVNAPNDRLIAGSGPVTATVALEDNDGAGKVEVSFGAATYTAIEGGSVATVSVQLDEAPGRSVTVPLAVTHLGGALPADYSGIPANVTFGANQKSMAFTVNATNDSAADGGESMRIGFGALPQGVLAGRPAATVVTLKDGTEQTFVVSFDSSPTYATEVREGNVGKRISVFLGNDPWGSVWNAEPRRPVTIPLVVTRTGGATAADHTAIPASVTFGVGRGGAGFDVRAIPDGETETGEGLRIDFGELPPGVTKGSWGHKTIAFVDAGAAAASVSVSGPLLTLSYPGALDAGSAPSGADFVVLAGPPGGEAVVPVMSVSVDGEAVLLTLARPVTAEETVTLTYLTAAMHPIRDAAGVAAAPLADEPVRNETGIPPERAAVPDGAQAGARPERLDLSSRNLTDLSALAGLSGVRELDLRDNAIADLSPLAGLTGLQVLDLSGNRIEELWPLAGLPALQRLNLSGNRIADIGMLSGLGGLQVLDLSGNRIEELWPLAGLPALRRLNLSGNRIADIGMLSGLGGLQVLDLSGNRIEELWPLAGLPALQRLNLSGNRITDIAMLSGLGGLQVLLLDRNRVADAGALSPLTGLANLGLSENRIEDIGLLGSLGPLRRLDLSGNAVADVSALGDVSELLWLRLSGNPVSDVAPLGRLEMLRWLWLDQGAATRMEALALPAGRGAAPLWIERVPAR